MEKKANIFEFSCRKATELMEKRTVSKLSAVERMQLFVHACVCDSCRYYGKQSAFLDQVLKKAPFPASKTGYRLDDSAKERILRRMEQ